MNSNYLIIILLLVASLCSCSGSIYKSARHSELTHQALFVNVKIKNLENVYYKVYWSPVLKYRPIIFPNNNELTQQKMKPELMLDNYPTKEYALIIPDSLKGVYQYYTDDLNIKADSVFAVFVSPLLPTEKKEVYIIQTAIYRTFKDYEIKFRLMYQQFDYYQIKKNKIKKINSVKSSEISF